MANRTVYNVTTPKSECQLLTAKLVGAGAANMTNGDSSTYGAGEIVSATRSDAGTFAIVFRSSYPALKSIVSVECVGTTAGLRGRFTAIDVAAKTATLKLEVGAVDTDPATTDTVYLNWLVRNSSQNG